MNNGAKQSGGWSWLWSFLILLFLGGILVAIAIPSFVGSRVSKLNAIINNLRVLDAAKNQWAFDHGITNFDQAAKSTNELSKQDLAKYLRPLHRNDDFVTSVADEIYSANKLMQPPEAKLVRKIEEWPPGSIIRYIDNSNIYLEVLLPDGKRTHFP